MEQWMDAYTRTAGIVVGLGGLVVLLIGITYLSIWTLDFVTRVFGIHKDFKDFIWDKYKPGVFTPGEDDKE